MEFKSAMGGYTIAEIRSEPETWKSCLQSTEVTAELRSFSDRLPRDIEWVFVGCGSSFYLAQAAAASWSILTGEKSRAIPASEITLFPQLLPLPCQPVLITRSGYTSETLEAAEYLEGKLKLKTLAITCAADTPIERMASHCLKLLAADEKSTVMTRSFTSMLLTLQALAAIRARRGDFVDALGRLPDQVANQFGRIESAIQSLVDSRKFADYVFLGQGPFFGIAQESMLKVKEMSCSYAQCFHTLEFRHGPKSIVSPDTLITFIISETGFDAEVAVLEEIKKLGGVTLIISNGQNSAIRDSADYLVELSLDVPELARAAASVIPGQLLGFSTGIKKGLNPDEPRNLSRVVMLESSK
ncbi:MAG: SIS domain-containing protein [Candidatus Acidiferrales bacterium]